MDEDPQPDPALRTFLVEVRSGIFMPDEIAEKIVGFKPVSANDHRAIVDAVVEWNRTWNGPDAVLPGVVRSAIRHLNGLDPWPGDPSVPGVSA